MQNLLHPDIECTDPDNLQFCLKESNSEFWYCEPNVYHPNLCFDGETTESAIYELYKGYPKNLLEDARTDEEVKAFVNNRCFWLSGSSEMSDFTHDEQIELLDDYGYKWDDFKDDVDRNQIICENFFEQHPLDFTHDY